jgi:hypothetical protein
VSVAIRFDLKLADLTLKKPYIDHPSPKEFSEEAAQKHENYEIGAEPAKIGGGNVAGASPGCISTLSNIINTTTMMKRE